MTSNDLLLSKRVAGAEQKLCNYDCFTFQCSNGKYHASSNQNVHLDIVLVDVKYQLLESYVQ